VKYFLNLIWLLAMAVLLPKLLYRRVRFGRYKDGWGERFGNVSRRQPQKQCIWIHAVSVGEVNSTRSLVAGLQAQFPDHELVMSVTTDTGHAQATKLFGKGMQIFYYPYDLSWVVGKALTRMDPAAIVLMELEVWPNMAGIARSRSIPVIVANGRLSERSLPKYRMVRWLTRRMFGDCSAILVQTREYASRFIELGAPSDRVKITGSLKYDTAEVADTIAGADVIQKQLAIGPEPLWVAGGTGDGEEAIVLDAYQNVLKSMPDLRLAIVPRKPERFDEVALLIADRGYDFVRYSQVKAGESAIDPLGHPEASPRSEGPVETTSRSDSANIKSKIILVDTMGDLRKFYSLATVIFVGRSLVPMGGSDMIEAAALARPTIFGPHTFNFAQDAEMLLSAGGAILVRDCSGLARETLKCLSDKQFASDLSARGRQVIKDNQGATAKTIREIATLLTGE
jgi:3-deoxy-D-manno-octulosonic-acid transferase